MLIQVPNKIYEMCRSKKYVWSPQHKELIRSGLTWESATQLFLGVKEDDVKLRESRRGADNGIDVIINGNKVQCKSCLFDGAKNFILLDKIFNLDCDFYALGKVYDDFKQAELIALLKTSEMMSFVEVGKILWHAEYSKWFYLLANSGQWMETQQKKKTISEGLNQNMKCLIYDAKPQVKMKKK